MTDVALRADGEQTKITLTFNADAPNPDSAFALGDGKPRFVMDWKTTNFSMDYPKNRIKGLGAIRGLRYASRGKGLRLVLDMEPQAKVVRRIQARREYHIWVGMDGALPAKGNASATATEAPTTTAPRATSHNALRVTRRAAFAPRYFKNKTPFPILKPLQNTTMKEGRIAKVARRPVIVIDPGHGGYDPGALGKKGTKEKTITFAASKELQRQLLATGRYEVILTRSKDVYVEHEERLRIARAGGADLFISIHADSAGPNARGATVYTLADRAKTRSRRITNTQNWIMDVDLGEQTDPVGDILVDLAQRSTQSNSTEFADILLQKLAGSTKLINNSHRRAGYFVLLAPDVPAVLLELGFISHPEDERLLRKESHRKKVMTSVTAAINRYFDSQKP